jgi:hypothetical protein
VFGVAGDPRRLFRAAVAASRDRVVEEFHHDANVVDFGLGLVGVRGSFARARSTIKQFCVKRPPL